MDHYWGELDPRSSSNTDRSLFVQIQLQCAWLLYATAQLRI
jgi:hypothetical protein